MKLFQKLFKRNKKQEEKQQECWYNNAHEQKRPRWLPPDAEGGALSSPNSVYYTESQRAENAQR